MWLASDWPLDNLSDHYLFSAHMVQHMTYAFVSAPLLLMGLPAWMARIPLSYRGLRKIMKVMTRPWFGLAYFNFMIVFIHWPPVVNAQLASDPFHFFIHIVILTSGLVMWWPVIDPVPELSRLSPPAKMLYLFLQSIIPTVPASFLTFSRHPLYSAYEHLPRYFGISVVNDQMLSGLIMKLGGGLLLWGVITYLFFRWYAQEENKQEETVSWDDFERELDAFDMRTD
jgi:putative membrane protein